MTSVLRRNRIEGMPREGCVKTEAETRETQHKPKNTKD